MNSGASSALPPIAGYIPTTMIDWPGRLASVIFLPQCNLKCRFCHAGSLLKAPAETIPLEAVLAHVAEREGWIDGIVICGGEPTIWPTLPRLCEAIREAGLRVKLDTNGTYPDRVAALVEAGLVDAVSMDLKAPLDDRYRTTCGAPDLDVAAIGRTVDLLMGSHVDYEFRTTVCPALHEESEIRAMGERIAGAARWVLQRFEPADALDPYLREVNPYRPAEMEGLAQIGRAYVHRCQIRGQPERGVATAGRA
jgi:pyruvate formate lyase activating enzyme